MNLENYYNLQEASDLLKIHPKVIITGKHAGFKLPKRKENVGGRSRLFFLKTDVHRLKDEREKRAERIAKGDQKHKEKHAYLVAIAQQKHEAQRNAYRQFYRIEGGNVYSGKTLVHQGTSEEVAKDYVALQQDKLLPVHPIFF